MVNLYYYVILTKYLEKIKLFFVILTEHFKLFHLTFDSYYQTPFSVYSTSATHF